MKTRILSVISVIVIGFSSVSQAVEWEGEWKPKVVYIDPDKGVFHDAFIEQNDRDGRAASMIVMCRQPLVNVSTGEIARQAGRAVFLMTLLPITSKVGAIYNTSVQWGDGQVARSHSFVQTTRNHLMMDLSFEEMSDWGRNLLKHGSVEYVLFDDTGEVARVRVISDGLAKGIRMLNSLCSKHARMLEMIGEEKS